MIYCGFVNCARCHNGSWRPKRLAYKNVHWFTGGIYAWKGMDYSVGLKDKSVVIVFLRAPEKGRVKTRLAREVGEERALALYKVFVQTTLLAVDRSGMDHRICFFPIDKQALVEDWLGPDHGYMPQQGNDLGERMGNALSDLFEQGASKAILVGTDIPEIRARHIVKAMDLLDHKPVVIGPSLDGGYWLIGFQRDKFCLDLFLQVDWGTETVFSSTLEKCNAANLSPGLLPALQDIDSLKDLQTFQKNNRLSGSIEDLIIFSQHPGGDSKDIQGDEYPVPDAGE